MRGVGAWRDDKSAHWVELIAEPALECRLVRDLHCGARAKAVREGLVGSRSAVTKACTSAECSKDSFAAALAERASLVYSAAPRHFKAMGAGSSKRRKAEVEVMPVSAAESGQQNGGSTGGLAAVISSTQAPAGTRTRVTRSPEPGDKPQEEGSGAAAAGASTEPPPMEFDVQVRAGNGDTFKVFVNERMKVSDLHEKISNLFACAPSAVRLVYKSKVLSHKPGETLGSFGIMPSEKPKPMLQLVVVRARLPCHASRALHTRTRPAAAGLFFAALAAFILHAYILFADISSHALFVSRLRCAQVRDGAAPKVEPPKPKPAAQTQKAGSWRSRRASG